MSESPRGWIPTTIIIVGSVGLMGAMLTDGLAVIGRHIGVPVVGSIEVSQAFVIVMASSAIAFASLGDQHAAVDLVFNRLPDWAKRAAMRVNAVLAFAFVAALVVASVWIAVEHWATDEQTELVKIPLRWFRVFWIAAACIAAGAFAISIFRKPKVD
jgi:TRAP-type transport system small permease protein